LAVRLGFTIATKPTVLANARYKTNWYVKPDADLKKLYNKVMGYLEQKEHGVYFAIQEIFGIEMADYATGMSHTNKP
jgi:hypothetical protein